MFYVPLLLSNRVLGNDFFILPKWLSVTLNSNDLKINTTCVTYLVRVSGADEQRRTDRRLQFLGLKPIHFFLANHTFFLIISSWHIYPQLDINVIFHRFKGTKSNRPYICY